MSANATNIDVLVEHYFADESRQITLDKQQVVIRQDGHNDRLYYVIEGELEGYFEDDISGQLTKLFSATKGAFFGVHSFFSGTWTSSSTVIAKSQVTLAWIDKQTEPVSPATLGPLSAQFMPVMVNELSRRQRRATQESLAKEKALQNLHTAEQMTTLGQLAAGIAHELNNAIGVVSSKAERLEGVVIQLLEEVDPQASQFFDLGLMNGQVASSSETRTRARELEKSLGLPRVQAKNLARATTKDTDLSVWLKQPELALQYWEFGRDLHDLRVAARHSVGIVKSVKQLGRSDAQPDELLDVNDSINKALSLLQSDLRRVSVRIRPAKLPLISGSVTELVQIWSNLIKNACDAMQEVESPQIDIQTKVMNGRISVTIANNGPEIDQSIRRKIFQPNFTTKKGGLSFGLGLGLAIVKRIVSEYRGSIAVKSNRDTTVFRVKLPVGEAYGKA